MMTRRLVPRVDRGSEITHRKKTHAVSGTSARPRDGLLPGRGSSGLRGAPSTVRFTRVLPADLNDLKTAVLDDLESLATGLAVIARSIPVPGRGEIDLLAADGRGRLALISIAVDATAASLGEAVSRWDWVVAHLGVLRQLMSGS